MLLTAARGAFAVLNEALLRSHAALTPITYLPRGNNIPPNERQTLLQYNLICKTVSCIVTRESLCDEGTGWKVCQSLFLWQSYGVETAYVW